MRIHLILLAVLTAWVPLPAHAGIAYFLGGDKIWEKVEVRTAGELPGFVQEEGLSSAGTADWPAGRLRRRAFSTRRRSMADGQHLYNGVVDREYGPHTDLLELMREVNTQVYPLIEYLR